MSSTFANGNYEKHHIPPSSEWPNRPVFVRPSPLMRNDEIVDCELTADGQEFEPPMDIHLNGGTEAYRFFSNHFLGKASIIIKGVENCPNDYFRNRQRKCRFVMQGQFIHPIPFTDIYTGQAMTEKIDYPPPDWIIRFFMPLIQAIQPAVCIRMNGDRPYLISPLMTTMQTIVVSEIGREPDITDLSVDLKEDTTLIDAAIFAGMKASERKKYFATKGNMEKYSFRTDLVYTFEFYQHLLNFSNFSLEYGIFGYDVARSLGCRCIEVMAIVWNPKREEEGGATSTDTSDTHSTKSVEVPKIPATNLTPSSGSSHSSNSTDSTVPQSVMTLPAVSLALPATIADITASGVLPLLPSLNAGASGEEETGKIDLLSMDIEAFSKITNLADVFGSSHYQYTPSVMMSPATASVACNTKTPFQPPPAAAAIAEAANAVETSSNANVVPSVNATIKERKSRKISKSELAAIRKMENWNNALRAAAESTSSSSALSPINNINNNTSQLMTERQSTDAIRQQQCPATTTTTLHVADDITTGGTMVSPSLQAATTASSSASSASAASSWYPRKQSPWDYVYNFEIWHEKCLR